MPTAQQIIESSLQIIGVLRPGWTMAAADNTHALEVLNQLLANWSADSLIIPGISIDTISLAGHPEYYIGPGANGVFGTAGVDTPRPIKLVAVKSKANNISLPVKIVTAEEFMQVRDDAATGSYVSICHWSGEHALGIGVLAVWPSSPTTGSTLIVRSLKPFTAFATLGTSADFPPGYEEALRLHLACLLAPEHARPVPEDVKQRAIASKAALLQMGAEIRGVAKEAS